MNQVVLSGEEREALERWARRPKSSQALALRCRIVPGGWGGPREPNLVERWFCDLTTKRLKRQTHRSVAELKDSINHWADNSNDNPRPFRCHKTADEIFDTMSAYMQQINHSGH